MKQFEFIKVQKPKKSVFDLSNEVKLTFNMGTLVPVQVIEVLPGDHIHFSQETLMRTMPMLAPIMHRVNVYTHSFFVPNRIIWDDWEKFLTGGVNGTDVVNHPKILDNMDTLSGTMGLGSLADYLGVPVTQFNDAYSTPIELSQLPFRAYQKIYNEYYRDQTLQSEIPIPTDSVNMSASSSGYGSLVNLRRRCWEKDYFTSALPFTQRGNPVTLPLAGQAPVSGRPIIGHYPSGNLPTERFTLIAEDGTGNFIGDSPTPTTAELQIIGGLEADLSQTTATSVNDLRRAYALSRWLEKNARAGVRYIEHILMHFGVKSSDSRLQRPEYLGGGKFPIQISEVLQTVKWDPEPLGQMGGHGITSGQTSGFSKFFEEHGLVLTIMSVIPRTGYSQGIPRIFTKFDKLQYYYPDFAHIGEQEVLNNELFVDTDDTYNKQTFGYQPRYSEYRTIPDTIKGDMRQSLDFWHLGRYFDTPPALNASFVQCVPDNRIFPVLTDDDKLIAQLYFSIRAIRPVSKFGDPI